MSTHGEHEAASLRVHVTGADVQLGQAPPRPEAPPASFYTIVLTARYPVRQLLPLAPSREYAIIQAFDNDVVLCDSEGQAQDAANADAALAAPQGALVATGVVLPLRNRNAVYVTASEFPSRVSVIAAYRD